MPGIKQVLQFMGWAFLFVVAAMLVWLFMESGRTRMAALGLIGFAAAVIGVFFVVLDAPERREGSRQVTGADVSEAAAQRAKIERSRTVLTPARIAMTAAQLTPGAETFWGKRWQTTRTPRPVLLDFPGKRQEPVR